MVRTHIVGAAIFLGLASPLVAQDVTVRPCLDRNTTIEQRECAEALYRGAAAAMELALARRLDQTLNPKDPASNAEAREALARAIRDSQTAWLAYRDAECRRVVGYGGGTGRPGWVWACLAEKTLQRVEELSVWFEQREHR